MKKILYLICLVFVVASCEPKFEKTYSWAYPIAGDWVVTVYLDSAYYAGPLEIKSYNSSFGRDSIWFDDYGIGVAKSSEYGNFWTMKYKVGVDMSTKTFSSDSTMNVIPDYGIFIDVSEGKIVGKDSIYFKIRFEDDPLNVYEVMGHRSTSYDDYMQNL